MQHVRSHVKGLILEIEFQTSTGEFRSHGNEYAYDISYPRKKVLYLLCETTYFMFIDYQMFLSFTRQLIVLMKIQEGQESNLISPISRKN